MGSPTYGKWESVLLDDVDRRCVYIAEGLGHAFMALTDRATVAYLCSEGYSPNREHGIHPADLARSARGPPTSSPLLSDKDAAAPSLEQAMDQGLLPDYEHCQQWYRVRDGALALREGRPTVSA